MIGFSTFLSHKLKIIEITAMGNVHFSASAKNESTLSVTHNDVQINDNCISRSASGAEISKQCLTQFVPIDKLAGILSQKTFDQFHINGIVSEVFVSEVFPQHTDLGTRLFRMLHVYSKASTSHLGTIAFRQQCERFLGLMDDAKIVEIYVKMYTQRWNAELIDRDGVTRLLLMCYTLAMQHSDNTVLCPAINRTFTSVTKSIFFSNEALSVGYVCRWFERNMIRVVLLVHKYCVHTLSTAYRGLEHNVSTFGIELQTPVLEQHAARVEPFYGCKSLLPLSQAWLLAAALPPLYSRPQTLPSPSTSKACSVQTFKDKLSMIPSHWTLLYNSNEHGMGANRFLHHVLGYRGPTLVLLHAQHEHTYCIAASAEWKETHLYTGGEDSCILQLLPKFEILEKNANILYLNTIIRGYPKGLRAGIDPRNPIIAVDENFENVNLKGIANCLLSIEVWGCGNKSSRDVQLDIKKWQIKEAERQRTVKLTAADWMDHPDRYLLELGGRQNYNN